MGRLFDFLRFIIIGLFLFMYTTSSCFGENVKKSVDDGQDDGVDDEQKEDSMDIASDLSEPSRNVTLCTRRKNTQMHEIRPASFNQFPFMVALMSPRDQYVCAGSLISNGLVLTTAQCTESVSYVLMNTTKDKKDNSTVSLHVIKTEKFPSYTGPNSIKNAAIIYTEKHNNTIASKINISNYTSTSGINEVEAIGFGLNADVGKVRELQYVGLDARITRGDVIEGFIDCIDTKVPTCFKDKGGPLIHDNELIGLITKGQDECTNEIVSTYAINKHMIDALAIYTVKAWLDEKIAKHVEPGDEPLEGFPKKPAVRVGVVHRMTSAGDDIKVTPLYYLYLPMLLGFSYY
ncbi:trypsin alpha-4-like [Maniola hyperantus]|uniref:trypsin alpha-4-like n=1 Tax=Aphantopus hyperantus TaxID=2795564 RepID=UPI00156A1BEF|nr:mite allergen Der f 6-like [Maniola hyperantus]